MRSDFACLILTHGRPGRVDTYKSLLKAGYTGRVYFIVDNEDKTAWEYVKKFGEDRVIVFDKAEVAKTFDEFDNFDDRRAVVYARNACFDIARSLGLKYFLQLDDDYTYFDYRFDHLYEYKFRLVKKNIDRIFEAMVRYYESLGDRVKSIAFAQNGDYIGGGKGSFGKELRLRRKCMNTFFCSVDRPFQFIGRINEDVNTYVAQQAKGLVFLTVPQVAIKQRATQSNSGGMTDIYLNSGTYIKSFYTVICAPSCTTIGLMGNKNMRLHHQIHWSKAVPCILEEKYRKTGKKQGKNAEGNTTGARKV